MPTNITYKNNKLTTVTPGQSKILKTSGKYLEDDLIVSNSSNLQGKTTSITPNTSTQTTTISPDSGYEGLSGVTITVNPIPSQYIIPAGTITITSNGTHDVSQYADAEVNISTVNNQNKTVVPSETTQSITADTGYSGLGTVTVNGITNTYVGSSVTRNPSISKGLSYDEETNIISNHIVVQTGYFDNRYATTSTIYPHQFLPTQETTTIIPSETAQTAVDIHKWTTGTITVDAITPTYVGSSVPAGSLTVSGPTVTASAGYYANAATKTIPNASLITEKTISAGAIQSSVDNTGLITTKLNSSAESFRVSQNNGYIEYANSTISISIPARTTTYQLPTLPAQSFTPSSSTQTVASTGKYMLGDITVEPIPSQYIVPSGTLTITSVDTTTTFDAKSYASVAVNLKNADVTAY